MSGIDPYLLQVENMSKINLLHATLYLKMGGLETFIMDLCHYHDQGKINIKVLCLSGYDPQYKEKLEALGIEVICITRNGRYDVNFFRKIIRLLRQLKIDVLHAHSGCVFNTVVCAYFARVPVKIVTEHGLPIYADGRPMPTTLKTRIEDYMVGKITDRIVAVSYEIEEHLICRYRYVAKKIVTIVNGIDTEKFIDQLATSPADWLIPRDRIIIGSVGRLVPVKNYQCLLDAFISLSTDNPKFHLVLVGDGPERLTLETKVKENGIQDKVTFLGVRNDIDRLLPQFDVFVLPSLTEGTSISLLEAQACGIPSVVTRVGGNVQIIDDGVNGFLVAVDDSEELKDKINRILNDDGLKQSLSENAKEKVQQKYDMKVVVRKYEDLYFSMLENVREK